MNSENILIERQPVVEKVKAYIESGILELYVLGDVTPEERLQVEDMIQKYPVIKTELEEMEKALEQYALTNAVEPSESQRSKILGSLLTNFADDSTFSSKKDKEATVITMQAKPTNFYKYAFAASVALLVTSLVALFSIYNQLQHSNQQLVVLNLQNQHISKTVSYMDGQLGVYRDTSYKLLRLKGTGNLPGGGVTVAWNPVKKKVMLDMATLKMPENDKAHQYQLWALVNGKPVDLGVFDKLANDTTDMKEMKSVALAGAFAVTREPRGGSVNPTMNEMMLIGQF